MSQPILNIEALNAACFAVARALLWERGPVAVEPIAELAGELARLTRRHTEYLTGQEYDPNIVTRAVEYFERHHALPTGGDTTSFEFCLDTLVELACCNTGPSAGSEPFYRDIEAGLARARAIY